MYFLRATELLAHFQNLVISHIPPPLGPKVLISICSQSNMYFVQLLVLWGHIFCLLSVTQRLNEYYCYSKVNHVVSLLYGGSTFPQKVHYRRFHYMLYMYVIEYWVQQEASKASSPSCNIKLTQ